MAALYVGHVRSRRVDVRIYLAACCIDYVRVQALMAELCDDFVTACLAARAHLQSQMAALDLDHMGHQLGQVAAWRHTSCRDPPFARP